VAGKSRTQWEVAKVIEATSDIRVNGGSVMTTPGTTAGLKIVGGVAAITGTGTVTHGLTTVTAVVVSLKDDVALTGDTVSATWSGTTVTLKVWKRTSSADCTPIAATAAKNVNWIAYGS
jgi:hypothetical protein